MKEVGASKRLAHIIEGESLVNDGSAYVVFIIFFDLAKGTDRSPIENFGYFWELVFGALGFGLLFGVILWLFLAAVFRCDFTQGLFKSFQSPCCKKADILAASCSQHSI